MGKQQRKKLYRRRTIIGGMKRPAASFSTGFAIVKTTAPELSEPDYQLVPLNNISLEQLRQEILTHIQAHHSNYQQWYVEVWDADHVPPGAVPNDLILSFMDEPEFSPSLREYLNLDHIDLSLPREIPEPEPGYDSTYLSKYIWCLHCERVYSATKWRTHGITRYGECPHCHAGEILDGWAWEKVSHINNYPDNPVEGKEYELYGPDATLE